MITFTERRFKKTEDRPAVIPAAARGGGGIRLNAAFSDVFITVFNSAFTIALIASFIAVFAAAVEWPVPGRRAQAFAAEAAGGKNIKKAAAVANSVKAGGQAGSAAPAALEYIPDNYDLFMRIRPAEFLNELSVYPKIKAFMALTPLKSVSAVKSISLFVAFGRHKKGNIDFIAAADMPDGFDYDRFVESLAAAGGDELIRTGEYEGKKIFRFYNLAGCRHGSKLILSSATGMKKALAGIKSPGGSESLAARRDFAGECARALKAGGGSPFVAVTGKKMLAAAAEYFDEGEFAYKKDVGRANFISFDASGRTLKIRAAFPDAAAAGAFKSSVEEQVAQSIKDSAEALAEVDLIETESASGAGAAPGGNANRKLTRLALKEIVFARKLLKFTLALNKTAKAAAPDSNSVEITAAAPDGLFKAIDELICAHPESWGIITRMFLSSEVSCFRNIKILETAALLYLAKFPEKKNTITAADLFESELLSDYLKCPEGGEYKISVEEKGRITVTCGAHGK